jgi:hypothetical protein
MWPLGANGGGLYCGYADGSPVSDRYTCPSIFTGTIHHVIVEVEDDHVANPELENYAAISED